MVLSGTKLLAGTLICIASLGVMAQVNTQRPAKIVVAFPPGGSTDITARLVAPKLAELWKQPVVVENRAGADANIGTEYVARAEPDGQTMLLVTTAIAVSAAVRESLSYNALRDFAPVTLVSTIANVLIVHPSVGAATPEQFVALARAKPGALNFAAPGAATGQRLAFELLKESTGIDVVHVPYKGGAPAVQAVLAGEVQSMIANVVETAPHIKSGKLRALAVTTLARSPMMPELPTLAETVAPGLDASVWQGVLVPAGTSKEVVAKLNHDWVSVLRAPEVRDTLGAMGMEITPASPEDFARMLREEIAKWSRVAKAANVKAE